MRKTHARRMLDVVVPFSTDVEKMGVHRTPVGVFAGTHDAARAYDRLAVEVIKRI